MIGCHALHHLKVIKTTVLLLPWCWKYKILQMSVLYPDCPCVPIKMSPVPPPRPWSCTRPARPLVLIRLSRLSHSVLVRPWRREVVRTAQPFYHADLEHHYIITKIFRTLNIFVITSCLPHPPAIVWLLARVTLPEYQSGHPQSSEMWREGHCELVAARHFRKNAYQVTLIWDQKLILSVCHLCYDRLRHANVQILESWYSWAEYSDYV